MCIRDRCEILNGFANELAVSRATKNEPLIEKAIAYLHANLLKNCLLYTSRCV